MYDNYLEEWHDSAFSSLQRLEELKARYQECGQYLCAGGFLVWADRSTLIDVE